MSSSLQESCIIAFKEQLYDKTLGDLPQYKTAGSAGMDIKACLPNGPVVLEAGQRVLIPTSLYPVFERDDVEMQIRSRSGLAYKHGIIVLNSPGTIDNDYRDEIGILLYNTSDEDFVVEHGMRIAQAIVAPYIRADVRFLKGSASTTTGRTGGFGSTGIR